MDLKSKGGSEGGRLFMCRLAALQGTLAAIAIVFTVNSKITD